MNLSGLLLSRAFLMWLRPTPLAPADKEGWKLEMGSGKPEEQCRAPAALPRTCCLSWSVVYSSPGSGTPCPGHTHL